MYKLYGAPGSASTAPHCLLEEVGAPYELVAVDLSGDARDPAYLKLNPHGRVPTLLIDGRPIFESAAICMVLADRHPQAGLAPTVDAAERPAYVQWMVYLTNTVQELMLQMFYPDRCTTEAADAPRVAAKARERIDHAMGVVDKALAADGPYLLGAKASAADIYLTMLSRWYDPQDRFAARFPHVARARELVAERPATARALAANG
jgi:glutathione S-transferase